MDAKKDWKIDAQFIKKSILAGLMIALGCYVYLACSNKIVGALLFSIGLITVNQFGLVLFTGKIGLARKLNESPYLIATLFFNTVGVLVLTFLPYEGVGAVVQSKLQAPLYEAFLKGVVCGILIYISVVKKENIIVTLIAVPAFILSGAEHSVADICFIFAAREFSFEAVFFVFTVVLGNAVGSIGFSLLTEEKVAQ